LAPSTGAAKRASVEEAQRSAHDDLAVCVVAGRVPEDRDQGQHREQREPHDHGDHEPANHQPIAMSAWTTLTELNGEPAIVPEYVAWPSTDAQP
jgi:hypothetical protein